MTMSLVTLLLRGVFPSVSRTQAPVFVITPGDSAIKFSVKA
jgi:hypothetical protein